MDNPIFKLEKVVHTRSEDEMQDFEGPLDLILFLLSKNKMEIQDISIALILEQYLAWLKARQRMDLEVASEFVAMMSGCIGLKTGYTQAAGRTLVSCAVRNGQRLVAVTLQDGNDWADHEQLYEYGFSNYPEKQAVTIGQTVRSVSIKDGFPSTIPLVAAEGFSWPVGNGETLTTEVRLTHAGSGPEKCASNGEKSEE